MTQERAKMKEITAADDVKGLSSRGHIIRSKEMYLPVCTVMPYTGLFLTRGGTLEERSVPVNVGLVHLGSEIISNAADNANSRNYLHNFGVELANAMKKGGASGPKPGVIDGLCARSLARIMLELTPTSNMVENYGSTFKLDYVLIDGKQYFIPYACFTISRVGSNFDGSKARSGIGRYGQGAKTVPIGSKKFVLTCVDAEKKIFYSFELCNNGDPTTLKETIWPTPVRGADGLWAIPPASRAGQPPAYVTAEFAKGTYTRVYWEPDFEIGPFGPEHIAHFGNHVRAGNTITVRSADNNYTNQRAVVVSAGVDPLVSLNGQNERLSRLKDIRFLKNENGGGPPDADGYPTNFTVTGSEFFFQESLSNSDDEIDLLGRYAKDITLSGIPVILRRKWSDGSSAEHILQPATVADYGRLIYGAVLTHYHKWSSSDNRGPVSCDVAYFDTPGAGKQVGFVNGVCTAATGIHVNSAIAALSIPLKADPTMKKDAPTADTRHFKQHITMIVSAVGTDPSQQGQTKEGLNEISGRKSFTMTQVAPEIVQRIVGTWKSIKTIILAAANDSKMAEIENQKTRLGKMGPVVSYIPANTKGPNSTLILTEGKSCMNYAEIVKNVHPSSNTIGILSLTGVPPNLYESDMTRLLRNGPMINIVRAMGIDPQKSYTTPEDLKTLDYGRIIMIGDPDLDGFHIISLMLANFWRFWPFLFHDRRIGVFRTPVVRIWSNNGERILARYYSDKEYDQAVTWRTSTNPEELARAAPNGSVKRIKGLGSVKIGSLDDPGIEILDDVQNAPVIWFHLDSNAVTALDIFFMKARTDDRKRAIIHCSKFCEDTMSECRVDPAANMIQLGPMPLMRRAVTNYISRELIQYSIGSLKRHIPYVRDGLKDVQRKIIAWWLENTNFGNNQARHKVEDMAGKISSEQDYHHGPMSLGGAIKRLAINNFPGANNVAILIPESGMGSRLDWPADCPQSRYAFVGGAKWMKLTIFKYIYESIGRMRSDDKDIEPPWIPSVIPYSIMNGIFGVATGWRSYIPAMHPTSVLQFLMELAIAEIRGRAAAPEPILFWYRGFKGSMEIKSGTQAILRTVDYVDSDELEAKRNAALAAGISYPEPGELPADEYFHLDADGNEPGAPGQSVHEETVYADRAIQFTGKFELLDPAKIKDDFRRDKTKIVSVLHISEVPPETRLMKLNYTIAQLIAAGFIHSYTSSTAKGVSYFLNLTPDGNKLYESGELIGRLHLRATYPLTNFFFLDDDGAPVKFVCIEDYLSAFYKSTIEAYGSGLRSQIDDLRAKYRDLGQQQVYIDACLRGQIQIGVMNRAQVRAEAQKLGVSDANVKKIDGYDINREGFAERGEHMVATLQKIDDLSKIRPCEVYRQDLEKLSHHLPTCPMPVKVGPNKWVSGEK